MATTIYWTWEHIRLGAREMRWRAACWWLGRQVEFLDWKLRLGFAMPSTRGPIARRIPFVAR